MKNVIDLVFGFFYVKKNERTCKGNDNNCFAISFNSSYIEDMQ